ncbi:MAG: lytic murein transglycosylase [Alphaproteobacteria bacterium]
MTRWALAARRLAAALFFLPLVLAGPVRAADGAPVAFAAWLDDLKKEAVARGISEPTVETALSGIEPIPRVIELDRHQPEFVQTLTQYLRKRVTDDLVEKGRRLLADDHALLAQIAAKHGVQPRFLVALWGIETNYGRFTGGFNVVQALVTLAFDDRRPQRFREELFDALKIIDGGDISASEMLGSWAGAMGQNQFMPSVFVRYAEDFDGDGRRNIWTSTADVLASAANYLAQSGWQPDQTWGRKVSLPGGFDYGLIDDFTKPLKDRDLRKHLSEWQALGVRREDGRDLPTRDLLASLILPEGPGGPAYLVYDNFRVLMTWNPAFLFAVTVGTLADRLEDG